MLEIKVLVPDSFFKGHPSGVLRHEYRIPKRGDWMFDFGDKGWLKAGHVYSSQYIVAVVEESEDKDDKWHRCLDQIRQALCRLEESE